MRSAFMKIFPLLGRFWALEGMECVCARLLATLIGVLGLSWHISLVLIKFTFYILPMLRKIQQINYKNLGINQTLIDFHTSTMCHSIGPSCMHMYLFLVPFALLFDKRKQKKFAVSLKIFLKLVDFKKDTYDYLFLF